MFYQIFLSPQVKQCAIITYKHGIDELPNDLRLKILGKCLSSIEWYPSVQSPHKMKILSILAKNSWKIAIKLFPYCAISGEN